jgi:O-antigen/teichoic acid export membrane protein
MGSSAEWCLHLSPKYDPPTSNEAPLLAPPQHPTLHRQSTRASSSRWLISWMARFAEFAFVQCWVQLFVAIAGMIVVRTLSKSEYALYAIANSIQAAANIMAELGIGIGVRSIGGRVWQDRERFGQLLNTAIKLRHAFAAVSMGACLPFATWMLRKNGADWPTTLLLCCVVVVGALPQLASSVLRVVPEFHREYRRIQKLDLGNSVLRFATTGVLALSYMNAWLAASTAAVTNWITMLALRRWAPEHADFAASTNADDRRELWRVSMRVFPNTAFYCFQGQITLLILALVGNPNGVADVTALGRLSALLTVFSLAFNGVLVPRFAQCQDTERLPRLYLGLVGAAALTLVPVVLAGWLTPGPLLWLLGAKYTGLEHACGWVVSTACVSQLSFAMVQLNAAKAWIRIGTVFYAPLTIAIQFLAFSTLDVSQVSGVVVFGFLSSLTSLPTLAADAYLGLRVRSQ